METLKKYWGYLATGLAGILGIVFYVLNRRGKEIDSLHAQIALADTEKKADILESQITELKADKNNLDKHNQELDKALAAVQNKRTEIAATQKELKDPKAIADYWNHQ